MKAQVTGYWRRIRFLASLPLAVTTVGCLSSTTQGDLGAARAESTFQVTVTSLDGAAPGAWPVDDDGDIQLPALSLAIGGACPRGVVAVKARVDGRPTGGLAMCSDDGNFAWSHAMASDGTYVVDIEPILSDGQASAPTRVGRIHLDTVAPAAPVFVSSGGQDIQTADCGVVLEGRVSADTAAISLLSGPSRAIRYAKGSGRFELVAALGLGETAVYAVVARDLAGNRSPAGVVRVACSSTSTLRLVSLAGVRAPAAVAGDAGQYVLQAIALTPFRTAPQPLPASDGGAWRLHSSVASAGAAR